MIIYLIRHGQSEGNVESDKKYIIHGQKDKSPLTKKGINQIKKITQLILNQKIKIDLVITSPQKRALQSAMIIKKNLKNNILLNIDDRLKDQDFGDFEGKSWDEIKEKYQSFFTLYQKNPLKTPWPKGEAKIDIIKRLSSFLKDIKKIKQKNVLIVTHEEIIRIILALIFNDKKYEIFKRKNLFKIKNATLTSIYLNKIKFIFNLSEDKKIYLFNESDLKIINDVIIKKIKNLIFIKKLFSFSNNLVFKISDKNFNYQILKISQINQKEKILKDIKISHYLKINLNLPTPQYFDYFQYKNYFLTIKKYDKNQIGDYFLKRKSTKEKFAFFMGKTLQNIHFQINSLLKKSDFISIFKEIYLQKKQWINMFLKSWFKNDIKILKKLNFFHKKIKKVENLFQSFLKNDINFTPSFLYYDFHPQNFTANFENESFEIKSLWDFENSFIGDKDWDLAYTIKLSFLKSKTLVKSFLKGYFNDQLKKTNINKIKIYLLLIITGSINYALKNKKNYKKEVANLNWYLKNIDLLFNF
jgi:broad specificity phosphatase PhoE